MRHLKTFRNASPLSAVMGEMVCFAVAGNNNRKLLGLLIGAVLLVLPAAGGEALDPHFVHVAEALSSPDAGKPIQAEYRMFSLPDFPKICAADGVARLVNRTGPVTLRVGEWFSPATLRVVAADRTGRVLPRVPLAIEVEKIEPPLLNLRPEAIGNSKLMPVRTGRFRFRVRTICPGTTVDLKIDAVVVSRR